MKICLTSYFGIRDALEGASNALKASGHTIVDYHLYEKGSHMDTKVDDLYHDMADFLASTKPDAVLWWCINIDVEIFSRLKREFGLKYYYFNWDDPYNWTHNKLQEYSPYLDVAFICSKESVERYESAGAKKAVYLLPGFDPEVFYPRSNKQYKYDVSMLLTNLYSNEKQFPDQTINRHLLVDKVAYGAKKHGFKFALFGPEFLGVLYPDFYQGYCPYRDQNQAFNTSKINLTTHVVGNSEGYLNERTVTLIGSGAFMLIDPVKGLEDNLKPNYNCLVLDIVDPVKQIVDILQNYDGLSFIGQNLALNRDDHTWENWAKKISSHIG